MKIDLKFKEIATINTLIGFLKWTCQPFGMKTLNHIFQKTTEKLLGKIKKYI